jgi:hypothetical protein
MWATAPKERNPGGVLGLWVGWREAVKKPTGAGEQEITAMENVWVRGFGCPMSCLEKSVRGSCAVYIIILIYNKI